MCSPLIGQTHRSAPTAIISKILYKNLSSQTNLCR